VGELILVAVELQATRAMQAAQAGSHGAEVTLPDASVLLLGGQLTWVWQLHPRLSLNSGNKE